MKNNAKPMNFKYCFQLSSKIKYLYVKITVYRK